MDLEGLTSNEAKLIKEQFAQQLRAQFVKLSKQKFSPVQELNINEYGEYCEHVVGSKSQFRLIVLSLGGTNWNSFVVELNGKSADVIQKFSKQFKSGERNLTKQRFIEYAIDLIQDAVKYCEENKLLYLPILSVSFAFPQKNFPTEYGLEASLDRKDLTKGWDIVDLTNEFLVGKSFLKLLSDVGRNAFKQTVVLNDTVASSFFISPNKSNDLPFAMVFGTGTNASVNGLNLEWGEFKLPSQIMSQDIRTSFGVMHEYSRKEDSVEFWLGGDYINQHFLWGLNFVAPNALEYIKSQIANGKTVSDFLNEFVHRFPDLQGEDTILIRELAGSVLKKAGQIGGILLGVTLQFFFPDTSDFELKTEGGLIWGDEIFRETLVRSAKATGGIGNIDLLESSSVIGIAQFASQYFLKKRLG